MLSAIKNFFKKQKPIQEEQEDLVNESIAAALILTISDENIISIDVDLKDFEVETIKNLANLLVSFSSYQFQIEMLAIIKQGFHDAGDSEKFNDLLEYILKTKEDKDEKDEPCINPSDVL